MPLAFLWPLVHARTRSHQYVRHKHLSCPSILPTLLALLLPLPQPDPGRHVRHVKLQRAHILGSWLEQGKVKAQQQIGHDQLNLVRSHVYPGTGMAAVAKVHAVVACGGDGALAADLGAGGVVHAGVAQRVEVWGF